jgi:HTH-type transcriptional regulator/antitoxin HipB
MDYPIRFSDQLKQQLRSLRKARGLTQAELGRRLGVTQARVAEIEAMPGAVGFDQLLKMLYALGTELIVRDVAVPSVEDIFNATAAAPDASATREFRSPLASARHLIAALRGEPPRPEAYLWRRDEPAIDNPAARDRRDLVEHLARALLVNPVMLAAALKRDAREVRASERDSPPVTEIQRQWAAALGVAPEMLARTVRDVVADRTAPSGFGRGQQKGTW